VSYDELPTQIYNNTILHIDGNHNIIQLQILMGRARNKLDTI
jgi:hypothetical protein